FDLAVKSLGDYEIVAPIREIQKEHTQTRAYEQKFLEERGFGVRAKQQAYTINENLLGVTMSGGEIDKWEAPGEGARGWCKPRAEWPSALLRVKIGFANGEAVSLDGEKLAGHKGRIVFEAPGLISLLTAHRALEEAVLSKQQNRFKPDVARKWVEVVYE